MILIDTNVFSETFKPVPDDKVVDWLHARNRETLLSSIVIAEIRFGIDITLGRSKRDLLVGWLNHLIESHSSDRILDFDTKSALAWGELLARFQLQDDYSGYRDSLLAAQAIAHDLPIATRNVKHFERTPAIVVNPWS